MKLTYSYTEPLVQWRATTPKRGIHLMVGFGRSFVYFLAGLNGAQTLPKLDECRAVTAAAPPTTRVARRISPRRGAHLLQNLAYMHAELRDARINPLSARCAGAKEPLECRSNGYNWCLALRSGGAEGAKGHRVMQTTRSDLLHGMDVLIGDAGVHCGTSTRRRRRSWSPNRADHPIRR